MRIVARLQRLQLCVHGGLKLRLVVDELLEALELSFMDRRSVSVLVSAIDMAHEMTRRANHGSEAGPDHAREMFVRSSSAVLATHDCSSC